MDLKKYLVERKKKVEAALEVYFAKCDCPAKLKESMLYSLRAGGKRLRPVLVMAAAEACGGNAEDVMPIAMAMEMIHTFSLIHDDLPSMDDDNLRRGQPTNHVKYGEAVAILAGDGLLSEAFSCLSVGAALCGRPKEGAEPLPYDVGATLSRRPREGTEPLPYDVGATLSRRPSPYIEIISDIANATGARGMVGGQVLDMDAENKIVPYEKLKEIHKGKTGALITVSVTSGAKAAGGSKVQVESLKKYGDAIGLAFQISDDILDIEGTTEELGKPANSDTKNKKSTYPAILGMEKSKKLAKELIDSAYSALAEFDSTADPLREIAKYIISRKN